MNGDGPPFQRRHTDQSRWARFRRYTNWFVRKNAYRDLWLLAITFVMWQGVQSLDSQQHRITEGRQFAVSTICAVESAVGQAGYDVITRGATGPETPFTRFLEQHGYPPPRVRQAQATIAGRLYVRSIARRVVGRVGWRGLSLIQADGSLNCTELERLAAVEPASK